jgi:DNA repair/transcription protein MET18/MMS19
LEILKTKSIEKHTDISEGIETIIPQIFTKVIQASLENTKNLVLNRHILKTLSMIVITIFSKVKSSDQKTFLDKSFKLFVDGNLSQFNITSNTKFNPLQTSSSDTQKETCQLFAAIVCSLRKDVSLPISSLEDYLNDLITLALSSENESQITSASRIIGSLVNKWKDSKQYTNYYYMFFN